VDMSVRADAHVRTDGGLRPHGRIVASARTRFLLRRRTVKTGPRGKRGRGRTSGRHLRTSGRNFPSKSSFMTSLL
jgi:hypothetical protein